MVVLAEGDLLEAGLEGPTCSFERAVIDSREVKPGDLFVCLKGESTDGHLYAVDAVKKGAAALLCQRDRLDVVQSLLQAAGDSEPPPILVAEDAVLALQSLGRIRRASYKGTVVAVVGSNGKTSTKEILASLLRSLHGDHAVFATPGNWNNHLGVPLSLCALPEAASFAVLELGMNHPGEIELLAGIARPHHCVVPSIGLEHMEFFADVNEVARAELEVLAGMEPGGHVVYPALAPGQEILTSRAREKDIAATRFSLSHGGADAPDHPGAVLSDAPVYSALYQNGRIVTHDTAFETGEYRGEAMASNVLACLSLLRAVPALLGVDASTDGSARASVASGADLRRLQEATRKLQPVAKGRFRMEQLGPTVLVDDTYNANPDSFRQSLRSLREILPGGRLLCLMGHMAELGHFSREGHEAVGEFLAASDFAGLLLAGREEVRLAGLAWQRARSQATGASDEIKYFDDSTALSNYIEQTPDAVRGWDGILVKGSRSARMEKVLPAIRAALQNRSA